jgi:hypothetical protein
MKLILSRKGFDSENGGCASPIFEDDSMVSLPIPSANAPHTLACATAHHAEFKSRDVLQDLTRRKAPANRRTKDLAVHLDPYLRCYGAAIPEAGWRPAFGQDGGAQGHLQNQNVDKGDLFLFFGWFRRVQLHHNGNWRYVPKSPDLHVLFGWLQIGEKLSVERDDPDSGLPKPWLADHPHWRCRSDMDEQNTIYVASEKLIVDDDDLGIPGGGVFRRFEPHLQLTDPDASGRSVWILPSWFHPDSEEKPRLSHHERKEGKKDRWSPLLSASQASTRLETVAKGQEFVMDLGATPKVSTRAWLRALFQDAR